MLQIFKSLKAHRFASPTMTKEIARRARHKILCVFRLDIPDRVHYKQRFRLRGVLTIVISENVGTRQRVMEKSGLFSIYYKGSMAGVEVSCRERG